MSVAVRRALYGKLSGDTTLNSYLGTPPAGKSKNIWHQTAGEGAEFPYVIFNKQSGTPAYTFKTGHAFLDNEVWLVKGVDHNMDSDPVDNIASRLDALLTDGTISISGAVHLYLRRESDVEYAETADGELIRHAGALYRLYYSAT